MPPPTHPVVLFDGVCNLCTGSVQFILRRDRHDRFRFASLQSGWAERELAAAGMADNRPDSLVLLQNGRAWTRSDAALRIARLLPGLWPLLYAFIIIPRPLRDAVYDWIARNRYRWFGRQESCWMPTPALKAKFYSD